MRIPSTLPLNILVIKTVQQFNGHFNFMNRMFKNLENNSNKKQINSTKWKVN